MTRKSEMIARLKSRIRYERKQITSEYTAGKVAGLEEATKILQTYFAEITKYVALGDKRIDLK